MLEGVFLSPFCPFQLGGKVFDLFTEIFLYYDFSVRNFAQNIKVSKHVSFINRVLTIPPFSTQWWSISAMATLWRCAKSRKKKSRTFWEYLIMRTAKTFDSSCRLGRVIFLLFYCINNSLLNFRTLVESEPHQNRIKLLTDDSYFKRIVFEKIVIIQRYIRRLHIFLKCLHCLVTDLPGSPLGKNVSIDR